MPAQRSPTTSDLDETQRTLHDLYARDATNTAVAVASGYGVTVAVERGQLVVADGIGKHRRQRRYPRAGRTLRRLVVAGSGAITLDALRWCADVGVAVVTVDPAGRVLATNGNGPGDARLHRVQAAAYGTAVGLDLARSLLTEKIAGQAGVLRQMFGDDNTARDLEAFDLLTAQRPDRLREIEAAAAIRYFKAWQGAQLRFIARDARRVPEHWHRYTIRRSPLHRGGPTPRDAAHPMNAMLNYLYSLAEAECRFACLAVGLDPGLGFLHTDQRGRDSLALDLLEVLRPHIERYVLRLAAGHTFRAADFHETVEGKCVLLPPLTHTLADTMPEWARVVAPVAERVAHTLGDTSTARIRRRTPLTQQNTRAEQQRRAQQRSIPVPSDQEASKSARAQSFKSSTIETTDGPKMPTRLCRACGVQLGSRRYSACHSCRKAELTDQAGHLATVGLTELARRRGLGDDPSATPEAIAKKSESNKRRRAFLAQWERDHPDTPKAEPVEFSRLILPGLAGLPLGAISTATGLSNSAASRVRSGKLTPHRAYWESLTNVIQTHRGAGPGRVAPDLRRPVDQLGGYQSNQHIG